MLSLNLSVLEAAVTLRDCVSITGDGGCLGYLGPKSLAVRTACSTHSRKKIIVEKNTKESHDVSSRDDSQLEFLIQGTFVAN